MNRTNAARLQAQVRTYALKLAIASIDGPARLPRPQVLPEVRAEVFEAYRIASSIGPAVSSIAKRIDACVYCCRTGDLVVDFLVPSRRDGTAHPDNLVPACPRCVTNRRSRQLDDWFEHRLDLDTPAIYARIAAATRILRRVHTVPLREAA